MGWNPDHRYKLLGKVIHANDEYLIAFDMTATEVYQRVFKDGERPKTSRTPAFPQDWQNQFGLSYKEHRQSMQIDIFDGYAVYGIKGNVAAKAKPEQLEEPSLNLPEPLRDPDASGGPNL